MSEKAPDFTLCRRVLFLLKLSTDGGWAANQGEIHLKNRKENQKTKDSRPSEK